MKKIFALVLTVLMAVSSLSFSTGCGNGGDTGNSTAIYVANYSGGVGTKWLDNAIKRFEAAYENESFEEGKTGVVVEVDHDKKYDGKQLQTTLRGNQYDIFFTQMVDYDKFASNESFLDITDLVTETKVYGEDKTILDKMNSSVAEALSIDGRYYAIPHYELYQGVSYDAGVFKSKNLYFSRIDAQDGTKEFVANANMPKSCGPDGLYDTYDDGLPSSFQEFFKLLDKMNGSGVKGFIWNGQGAAYTNMLMTTLYANLAGAAEASYLNTLNSGDTLIEVVTGFNGDEPQIEKVKITESNAYLLKQSIAIYRALEFAEKVFSSQGKYYYPGTNGETVSNLRAMELMLNSGVNQNLSEKVYAGMIIEGNYWYNEALDDGQFDDLKESCPDTYMKKDLKWMPMPHLLEGTAEVLPDGSEGNAQVLMDCYNSYAFIKADIPAGRIEASKAFLAFLYSDAELREFTKDCSGVLKGVNYDTSSIKSSLPTYGQSVLEIRQKSVEQNALIKTISNNKRFNQMITEFAISEQGFWDSSEKTFAIDAFYGKGVTLKNYFTGMWLKADNWNSGTNA